MAKKTANNRQRRNAAPAATVTPISNAADLLSKIPRSTHAVVQKLRDKFVGVAEAFGNALKKRAEIVDDYMATWNVVNTALAAENPPRGPMNFVQYARLIDPSIPTERTGENSYRNHAGYQAAEYIRRLYNQRQANEARTGNAAGTGTDEEGNPVNARGQRVAAFSPAQQLHRTLATVLQVIAPSQHAALWRQVGEELKLTPEMVDNLKAAVAETTPLIDLSSLKGKARTVKVLHMEPARRTRRSGIETQAAANLATAGEQQPPQQRRRTA